MARIRTLKPEFFRSPDTASVDFPVRIFYQALWCWADDFGVGETNINGLLGFAFPDDDEFTAQDVRRFCAECARAYGTVFYTVRGRHYYSIPAWSEHQKLESREDRRKFPPPSDPDAVPDLRFQPRADSAPEQRRESGADSALEEGRRKKEEGREENLPDPDGSSDSDPLEHITETDFPGTFEPIPTGYTQAFERWWETYPRKTGKRKAFLAWKSARKRATEQQLLDGAQRYADDPNRTDAFTKYPEGWLSRDGWLDEPLPPGIKAASGIEW